MKFDTIAIAAADGPEARQALKNLSGRYETVAAEDADIVVALGGDGFMLETLHRHMPEGKPIYGMNRGSIGFLMNAYEEEGLLERLKKAEPVQVQATDGSGHFCVNAPYPPGSGNRNGTECPGSAPDGRMLPERGPGGPLRGCRPAGTERPRPA